MNTPSKPKRTKKFIRPSKFKIRKGTLESPSSQLRWSVNGASRLGKVRSENQDAYDFLRISSDEAFFVVCDGAGGLPGGKEAAETAVQVIIMTLQDIHREAFEPTACLELAIEEARCVAKDHGLPGITTAIIAHVKGRMLHYATLGDGTLSAIWPDGMVNHIQTPHHIHGQSSNIIGAYIGQDCQVPARTGSSRIEVGTSLLLMSDGCSDLFPYDNFAQDRLDYSAIMGGGTDVPLADKLLEQIEAARDPDTDAYLHHDNMTLILAHLHEEEINRQADHV